MDTKIDTRSPLSDEEERRQEKEFEAGAISTSSERSGSGPSVNEEKRDQAGDDKPASEEVEAAGVRDDSAPPDGGYGKST